ncbi:MAG: CaiB/BaiF CoA transferase family protein [Hyphomicrobiales bacterium]
MAGALEGVRVLDCTQIIAGPACAALLSEMGAEVVKVESLQGEPWRLQAELLPKESREFLVQNRGKLGLAADLKHPAAKDMRRRLLEWADVVITNYRPGVAEGLGIDYPSVRAVNPRIIHCEIQAQGKHGPRAGQRGYDVIAQAVTGLTTSNPNIRDGLPVQVAFAPADVVTGVACAWAISAALYHRERTGEGQAIEANLFLTALFLQSAMREITALDREPRAERLRQLNAARKRGADITELYALRRANYPALAGNIYYRHYRTADGYIAVGCLGPEPRARFRAALGIHDPRFDPDFEHTPENIRAVGTQLVAKCEAMFVARTTDDWLGELSSHDIPCGPLKFVDELWDDPEVVANGYLTTYEHTLFGPLAGPVPIVSMSATPTRVQRAAPALGEHTDELLRRLGYDDARIAELREAGAIL